MKFFRLEICIHRLKINVSQFGRIWSEAAPPTAATEFLVLVNA